MNLQIIGDNFEITESIRFLVQEKIIDKLDKLLIKTPEDLKIASLRIQKNKIGDFIVNFDMNLPGKTHIYGQASHISFESALVDLEEEIATQIKKFRHQ